MNTISNYCRFIGRLTDSPKVVEFEFEETKDDIDILCDELFTQTPIKFRPRKAKQLEEYGINVVERMPLIVGVVNENRDYLETKAKRMGHEIDLDGE